MSVEATNWVWKHSRSRGAARLVLLAIADFGNDNHQAWPSMQTLAAKTALGERTVHRAIAQLMKMGELRIEYNAGPKLCNLYQVVMTPANLTPPSERHPRQSDTPANLTPPPSDPERGAIHDTQGVPIWHPEPSVEPSGNHQVPTPLSVVPTDAAVNHDIRQVWETYLDACQRVGISVNARLTPKRRDKIRTRLKAFPLQDVLDAAQGWTLDPWPERRNHCDAAQIFKSDEQLEKFRDLWRDGPPPAAHSTPTKRLLAEDARLARWADTLEGGEHAAERMAPHRGQARRELPRPGPPG